MMSMIVRCHHNHPYMPQYFISMFFYIFFLVFTEWLYTFRLCSYTWPPTCTNVTWDSHHDTTTGTNQMMTNFGCHHYNHNHPYPPQHVITQLIGMFSFCLLHPNEQLYNLGVHYYTRPPPPACLTQVIIQQWWNGLEMHQCLGSLVCVWFIYLT